ncbi:MAG TPA: DUF4157 domain-containing protein [Pyrinomonadaceae bacterium]|nr:DUF4157 domain-containing protein [Pyrinomonadaceae bacterium]
MTRRAFSKFEPARAKGLVSGGVLQRKCACGKNTAGGGECGACNRAHGQLQRRGAGSTQDASSVPDSVHEVLSSNGSPIEPQTRAFMESRFGESFSHVRVHTDAKAAESARALHARAFTVGSDIVFAGSSAARDPSTLAHELTHVVQQSRGLVPSSGGLRVSPPNTAHEHEADRVARDVLSDARAEGGAAPSPAQTSIQRENGDPEKKDAPEEKPPHKMTELSTDPKEKHKASDAIVSDFQDASKIVKDETGVDLTLKPGDTTRRLSSKTEKVGADNFSWHKTGRAIDINQSHKWLIVKELAGDRVQFRIYLEKTSTAPGKYDRTFPKEPKPDFQHNPFRKKVYEKTFVDVTQALTDEGFSRIPAQKGWEKSYNKQEWWHYEKRDGKNMYEALQDVYTEDEIVKGYKGLATNKKTGRAPTAALVRMHKEGFPYETIKNISPKTPNAERDIEISMAKAGLKEKDYTQAALYLNGLNEDDIKKQLKGMKKDAKEKIHAAALAHPGLGPGSNIAKLTAT